MIKQENNHIFKKQVKAGGFTLIELLVSMAMFSVVVVVVTDIFLTGLGGANRIFGAQAVQESGRFILESMLKEIRMSKVNTANGTSNTLNITNSKGQTLDYTFNNVAKQLLRDGNILNPNKVELTGTFFIQENDGLKQARVTIMIQLINKAETNKEKAVINLQTTVSSRQYAP